MNRIAAHVTDIADSKGITIVTFDAGGVPMRMMALGLNLPLREGSAVTLGVKATNIALAKALRGDLSISNRLEAVIEEVEDGELLSRIMLRVRRSVLECITTVEASRAMGLKAGDTVTALIKASELSVLSVAEESK